MRHPWKASMALCLAASIWFGCSEDQGPNNGDQTPKGTIKMTVNGTATSIGVRDSIADTLIGSSAMLDTFARLTIYGKNYTTKEELFIVATGFTGTGVIAVGGTAQTASANYSKGEIAGSIVSYSTDPTHTGTINVTKFDSTARLISGLFSFKAKKVFPTGDTGTVTISNGVFVDLPVDMPGR